MEVSIPHQEQQTESDSVHCSNISQVQCAPSPPHPVFVPDDGDDHPDVKECTTCTTSTPICASSTNTTPKRTNQTKLKFQPSTCSASKKKKKKKKKAVLSPLQKKLEQESIEARSLRRTPDVPKIEALSIGVGGDTSDDGDIHNNEKDDGGSDPGEGVQDDDDDDDDHVHTSGKGQGSVGAVSPTSNSKILSPKIHRSPSHRRLRVRTLENGQYLFDSVKNEPIIDIATTERMKRNTDSMLEDVIIATKLKRRLTSRREVGMTKRTINDTSLSDFIKQSILNEGSLDALSIIRPTDDQLCRAADIALKGCLQGYFKDVADEVTKNKAQQIFLESLIREEFYEGDLICRQHDVGDKLFVIEEGIAEFIIGGQVAGKIQNGNIFGELALVYGTPRYATVRAVTPSLMVWSLDAISFRKIQALVATESLRALNPESRKDKLKQFRRQCSSLSDLQEQSHAHLKGIDLGSYERLAIIGKGTFGSVYLVSLKENEKSKGENAQTKYYALKCMSKVSIVSRNNMKRVLIEKNILQEMKSSFIISLFGTQHDTSCVYFLTDFVQGGNLMSYMVEKDILSHSECMFFSANIVSALVHLHHRGIVHRDLKPENCLIDRNGYLKLCDFGMAKRLPSIVQLPNGGTEVVTLAFTMCGTPEFMAPEFVLSTGYDKSVDIWALGCILVEMYIGRSPFAFDGDLKKTFREVCFIGMGKKNYTRPDILREKGLEAAGRFTEELLSRSQQRLGKDDSTELQRHEYFESINFRLLEDQRFTPPYLPKLSHASDVSHFRNDVDRTSEDIVEPYDGDDSWCEDF